MSKVCRLLHDSQASEYASMAWDPHIKTQKESSERVQKKAVRFVANEYSWEEVSITKILSDLEWSSLLKV